MNYKRFLILALLLLPLAAATAVGAEKMSEKSMVGLVEFTVSCNEEAQGRFEHAVAMLHNMMYLQAEEEFRAVAAADESCAMGWWGVAMSRFHPLWAPPKPDDLDVGVEALAKARALGAGTPRERAYIAAAEAFFLQNDQRDHKTRVSGWEGAQRAIYSAWPDDLEAAAFYGLARLATAPKADKSFTQQKEAGLLLEALQAEAGQHPAGYHYVIHAYDNPPLADKALETARGYDKIAPDVPHALHMPTHIFVRLGLWKETEAWNRRSAVAARTMNEKTASLHYVHALDYEVYAALQQNRDARAKELMEVVAALDDVQDSFASAYGIAAVPARYCLERNDWAGAAGLDTRYPGGLDWNKYPMYESISWYAKALGAARSGDVEAARQALVKLEELQGKSQASGQKYWTVLVDAQRATAAAWVTYAEGDKEKALEAMRVAADLEDSVDKHPVTPGSVRPARELLGEMLLKLDRPAEALEAFETALAKSPGRFNGLYGAGFSAEKAGDADKASAYYKELITMVEEGSDRPEVAHATAYANK